jgi:hypothetical protein
MSPERSCISIVEVQDRLVELSRKPIADVKSGPVAVYEIRGTSRAEHASGARRAGSVEAHDGHVMYTNASLGCGYLKPFRDLI